jgi:hypothetical protein
MFLGAALLLFKQSGFQLLAVSVLLPLARLRGKEGGAHRPAKEFLWNAVLVIAVIAGSVVAANAFIPAEFNATREEFNRRWVMSLPELAAPPMAIWRANLLMVADYIGSYYSWPVLLFFCIFSCRALWRKNFPELTLALMCLVGGTAVIFLLRGFNEYLINTALITALLPLLARMAVLVANLFREKGNAWLRYAGLICAGFILAHWTYQDILMVISPGRYLERSSSWAIANYLKSWSTGFGVREIVEMLAKETRPGVVFVDSQWGNPGTALEVYGKKRFPRLRIAVITREFLDRNETQKLKEFVPLFGPARFVVYSADTSERRQRWQANIEEQMCETRTEIKVYPAQTPIVVCQF